MKLWNGWFVCNDRQEYDYDNLDWCREQFGPSNANGRWFYTNGSFYFKNEPDAMWFELRW